MDDAERQRQRRFSRHAENMRRGSDGIGTRQSRHSGDAVQVAQGAMFDRTRRIGFFELQAGLMLRTDERRAIKRRARGVVLKRGVVSGDPHGALAGEKSRQDQERHAPPQRRLHDNKVTLSGPRETAEGVYISNVHLRRSLALGLCLGVVLFVASFSTAGQAQSLPTLRPEDSGQWESLVPADARLGLSPDGSVLAYRIDRSNWDDELRVVRVSNGTPIRSSSAWIFWLTADGDMPRSFAAALKLR